MNILILGANGFIGSHLTERILQKKAWQLFALDKANHHLKTHINHPRFHFLQGDMLAHSAWIEEKIKLCDVVIPLAAIATPATYIKNPLAVFELDFEANLTIIRQCVRYQKRLIFPSTSEVYGMCEDAEFDEEMSSFMTGPIHKERWIYATSKQLLDRIIYAYSKQAGLRFTLFRPFNWYGPRLDNFMQDSRGSSRVLTQFIGNIFRQENILLVNGGLQKRCFTYIDDGIDALLKIIENQQACAEGRIFNIGHPWTNISIRDLAELLIQIMQNHSAYQKEILTSLESVSAEQYYGEGYQDVLQRVPSIRRAKQYLGWEPKIDLEEGIRKMLDAIVTPTFLAMTSY